MATTTLIDGAGRTLMPGLIDAHTHLMMATMSHRRADHRRSQLYRAPRRRRAADFLMQGFTTARDMGGPVFGLKRAIDDGLVPGPRSIPRAR